MTCASFTDKQPQLACSSQHPPTRAHRSLFHCHHTEYQSQELAQELGHQAVRLHLPSGRRFLRAHRLGSRIHSSSDGWGLHAEKMAHLLEVHLKQVQHKAPVMQEDLFYFILIIIIITITEMYAASCFIVLSISHSMRLTTIKKRINIIHLLQGHSKHTKTKTYKVHLRVTHTYLCKLIRHTHKHPHLPIHTHDTLASLLHRQNKCTFPQDLSGRADSEHQSFWKAVPHWSVWVGLA